MGDRGNIAVLQEDGKQVWLYSHWGGSQLKQNIKDGLILASDKQAKYPQSRWDDEAYLTKIIFCVAIGKENFDKLTGFGISTRLADNSYPINVVDIPKQRVFTIPESKLVKFQVPLDYEPEKDSVWSFDDYIKAEIQEPVYGRG